ncbi:MULTISPECIES: SusF/SusE family outer membrane protein [Flammeovirga]|uniref:SusF/SusE family outer membrane protein n=1 Tax=Flammeovirga agarivorans TaxID=2726742 RepID=A0A7X8XYD3_9BACT|nr:MULTISPECIES: SusF/SusE family outer membrane protein [Flammeovirga]NLR94112.1 SusF/SusE family outer membrane protein [Flammeovirga agarivorans]
MRKIFLYISLLTIAFSCKDLREPVLGDSSTFTSPVITDGPTEGAQYLLVEDSAANVFANYVWTPAKFGITTEVKYNILVKATDADGEEVIATITKSDTTGAPKVEELNGAMASLGLTPEVEHDVETWISAYMSDNNSTESAYTTVSEKIAFKATPYYQPVITGNKLGVPGDHQDWNPDNEKTVVVEVEANSGTYIAYLNLNNNFKFATGPGWDGTNYGLKTAAADKLSGELDTEPTAGNIETPAAGDYYVSMSSTGLTYSITPMTWMVVDGDGNEVATLGYVKSKVRWEAAVTMDPAKQYFFKGNDDHFFGAGEGNLLEFKGSTGMTGDGSVKMIMTLINPAEPVYSILGKEPITTPVISSPGTGDSFTLSADDFNAPATTVTWSASVRGTETPINYRVQVGDNVLAQVGGTDLEAVLKTSDLNKGALASGGTPGTAGDVNIKVVAVFGDGDTGASDEVTLSVNPFQIWSIIGSATPGGWDADTEMTLVSGSEYKIQVKLVSGEIKFRPNYDWAGNYGGSGGNLVLDGSNIPVSEDGWYEIIADFSALTYSVVKMTLPNDQYWGIIGSATPNGWDPDTDMVYDSGAGTWTYTGYLAQGEYKFRADDSWDYQMGKSDSDDDVLVGGSNQASITIDTPGNYTITCTFDSNTDSGTHSRVSN